MTLTSLAVTGFISTASAAAIQIVANLNRLPGQAAPGSAAEAFNQAAAKKEILLDATLLLVCVAGSVFGGIMSLAFYPPKTSDGAERSIKTDAMRWSACFVFGLSFSPLLLEQILPRWLGIYPSTGVAMAVSALLGMLSWMLAPLLPDVAVALKKRWFPEKNDK